MSTNVYLRINSQNEFICQSFKVSLSLRIFCNVKSLNLSINS